jgi:uncharacterized protein (TIGR02284 family)
LGPTLELAVGSLVWRSGDCGTIKGAECLPSESEDIMADSGSLASLHTTLIDDLKGYEDAIQDAEQPELKMVFRRLRLAHEKAHAELHHLLLARGMKPDERGSFMSTVHKTIISVRSAVVGLNEEALSAFADGEERIVEHYNSAIEDNRDDAPLVGLLEQQKEALQEEIRIMRATTDGKLD